jgi:type II secretory pathway pseudopilin PulG
VIAVIAVLVAILLPSLSRAREAGRRAVCMGNLRQIQTAWWAYATDHGDYIVNGHPWWSFRSAQNPWYVDGDPWLIGSGQPGYLENARQGEALMRTGALAKYVGDVRAYMCPSRYRPVVDARENMWSQYLSSYSISVQMNFYPPEKWRDMDRAIRAAFQVGRTVLFIQKTSELADPGPSARMVFMDWGFGMGWGKVWVAWGFADESGRWRGSWTSLCPIPIPIHHANGTCVSFADGHAEYWKWKDPATITWARAWLPNITQGCQVDPPRPPDWSPTPPQDDSPDVIRFHKAVWGK